jgi:hypothetical protein
VLCEFSEFSYGYAVVREAEATLASVYKSLGAPVLPSLKQEKQVGYDARLRHADFVLCLQFKRTEYISRQNPASPTWPAFGSPHFRFAIDTGGHQHQALMGLEHDLTSRQVGEVLYVSPLFHTQAEFDAAYAGGKVLEHSLLVPPSEFAAGSGKHHYASDALGTNLVLSRPREPEHRATWARLEEAVRGRAEIAASRRDARRVTLGEVEEILSRAAERTRPLPYRQLDVPVERRIERLGALLDCGVLVFTIDESDDEPADV